jgi:hypothetical protein
MEETKNFEINKVNDLGKQLEEAISKSTNKPSEEEIEQAKILFETTSQEFATKSWKIGDAKDTMIFIDYLNHFIRNRLFWTKTGWMGVIKITEELKDSEKFAKANPDSPLKLGFQALEFVLYSLQNPGGVGLQTALDFEAENEVFIKLYDAIGNKVAKVRDELKHIQYLQDQYTAMLQGFYLEIEPDPEIETEENAPNIETGLQLESNEIDLSKECEDCPEN